MREIAKELNLLVFRYLQDSGFGHAAFSLWYEASIHDGGIAGEVIPAGALIGLVQEGLEYKELKANTDENAEEVDKVSARLETLEIITKDVDGLREIVKKRKCERRRIDGDKVNRKRQIEDQGHHPGGERETGCHGKEKYQKRRNSRTLGDIAEEGEKERGKQHTEPSKRAAVPVEQSLLCGLLPRRHAEKRFRIAPESCFEGEGSHWASSSAFHIHDAARHNRSGPKSTGKHKAASESSGRPPKSKIQRTAEPHEAPGVTHDFLRGPGRPSTSAAAEFHITQSLSDFGIEDSEFTYVEDLSLEADAEFAPHQYEPGSLSGIELDPVVDLTEDIG